MAIRDGGQGDVTETHVLWTERRRPARYCSPLVTGPVRAAARLLRQPTCYDRMQGGEPLWEEDFGAMFTLVAQPGRRADLSCSATTVK